MSVKIYCIFDLELSFPLNKTTFPLPKKNKNILFKNLACFHHEKPYRGKIEWVKEKTSEDKQYSIVKSL